MRLFLQWKWYPHVVNKRCCNILDKTNWSSFAKACFDAMMIFFTVSFVFEDGMSKSFLQIKS